MTRFEDKDPVESVVLEFDFAATAAALSGTPTVEVTVDPSQALLEPAPNGIKTGVISIVGTKVLQRVQAGVNLVDYFFRCTAVSTNGDTLTIDAAMLVKTRPVVYALTPRYLTRLQFENRFGEEELTDLEASGNSFGQCENEAASLIDGYMAVKYTLPLLTVPALVTGWAQDITRFKLWDERAPQEVKDRYEMAITQLEQLAKGLIALPPDASGVVPTAGFAFAGFSATRVFNEDTLSGF